MIKERLCSNQALIKCINYVSSTNNINGWNLSKYTWKICASQGMDWQIYTLYSIIDEMENFKFMFNRPLVTFIAQPKSVQVNIQKEGHSTRNTMLYLYSHFTSFKEEALLYMCKTIISTSPVAVFLQL